MSEPSKATPPSGSVTPMAVCPISEKSFVSRVNPQGYQDPQKDLRPGTFNIAQISGNWGRVSLDFFRLFLEKYPSAKLMQMHDPTLPVPPLGDNPKLVAMGKTARDAGCVAVACACNTAHMAKKEFEREAGIKMVDLISATKVHVVRDFSAKKRPSKEDAGPVRVGVVGTKQTMNSALYDFTEEDIQDFYRIHPTLVSDSSPSVAVPFSESPCSTLSSLSSASPSLPRAADAAQLKQAKTARVFQKIIPLPAEQDWLHDDVIVRNVKVPTGFLCHEFLEFLHKFAARDDLDCIVLGCTDLPSLLQERVENKFEFQVASEIDVGVNKNVMSVVGIENKREIVVRGKVVKLYDSTECLINELGDYVSRFANAMVEESQVQ